MAKTIKEIIGALKKKLNAEELTKVETEVTEILDAEATMETALKNANTEAKNSRELKEELETENAEIKEKLDKKPKDDDPKKKDEEMPTWFKPYADDIEKSKLKEKTDEQVTVIKTKIEKALGDAKYPKTLSKFFHVKDFEKLDDEVSTFVQDLKNEDLKGVIVPPKSDDKDGSASETIKEYANSKNKSSEFSEISGKELEA